MGVVQFVDQPIALFIYIGAMRYVTWPIMSRKKILFGVALLVPLLGAALPAEAAKVDATAARAVCFKQANAAALAAGNASSTPIGERNSLGYDAYAACCRKAGIRP